MSLWLCEKGHHTGPGSEMVCFICGTPTRRVEMPVDPDAQKVEGLVIDDTDECLGCQ